MSPSHPRSWSWPQSSPSTLEAWRKRLLGATRDAREVLEEIRRRAEQAEGDPSTNPIPHMAPEMLAGEIALRTGDPEAAVAHFQATTDIEDGLLYEEPPPLVLPDASLSGESPIGGREARRGRSKPTARI